MPKEAQKHMEETVKQTMENAKTLAGVVHDIAVSAATPMVGEVITTQSQLTARVVELENDMASAEGNMLNLMQMTDKAVASIRADLHSAVVEMHNPDDERMAKVEKRVHRLEEQMTQLIELLAGAANLE